MLILNKLVTQTFIDAEISILMESAKCWIFPDPVTNCCVKFDKSNYNLQQFLFFLGFGGVAGLGSFRTNGKKRVFIAFLKQIAICIMPRAIGSSKHQACVKYRARFKWALNRAGKKRHVGHNLNIHWCT